MPNYIVNKLNILCDDEKIMHRIKKVIINENKDEKEPVTMSKLLPPPEENCEIIWCWAVWGTKWDMFNASIKINNNTELTWIYDTAWTPNCEWTCALCRYIQSIIDSLVSDEIPVIKVEQHFYDDSGWGFAGILTWTPNSEITVHQYEFMEYLFTYDKPYHDYLVEKIGLEPFYPELKRFNELCEKFDQK